MSDNDLILRSKVNYVKHDYKTVGQMAWHRLNQLDPELVCLIDASTDERLTIAELKTRANSIAVALIERGINKTDKIAFYGQNSIQHSILRFVAYFLGNTILTLSPTYGKHEVKEEITSVGANYIFSSAQDLHKFDEIFETNNSFVKLVVVFDGKHDKYTTYEQLLDEGKGQTLARYPHFDIDPEKDMWVLIHTSGSTGKPKCAKTPHQTCIEGIDDLISWVSHEDIGHMIFAMVYPYGHIGGTVHLPAHILNGSTSVLYPVLSEDLLYESIAKYKINVLPAFPHFGRRLIEGAVAEKYDLSSLKLMCTAGAAFPGNIAKAIIDKYGLSFREGYGMTEYFGVSFPWMDRQFISGNVGNVCSGTEVKIIDLNNGRPLGANVDGEICVRGKLMFKGYLNDEKASREAIDDEGWYRTGDFGHYDDKHRLYITDRLKEVIRIGIDNTYINISPVEIEQYLLTHKAIAEVAVIGVNNTTGTHWPRAYIVLKEGQTISAEDIQKYVTDTLSYTKQLRGGVVFVDHIQRTSLGKVDRKHYRNVVKDEVIE